MERPRFLRVGSGWWRVVSSIPSPVLQRLGWLVVVAQVFSLSIIVDANATRFASRVLEFPFAVAICVATFGGIMWTFVHLMTAVPLEIGHRVEGLRRRQPLMVLLGLMLLALTMVFFD